MVDSRRTPPEQMTADELNDWILFGDETEAAPHRELPAVRIGSAWVHRLDQQETLDHLFGSLDVGRGGFLVTPNLHYLKEQHEHPDIAAELAEATLAVPDGTPLLWAAQLQGTPFPGRVAGSDLIYPLAERAAHAGRRVFLLGGHPATVASDAAAELVGHNPGLKICGTYSPKVGYRDDPATLDEIESELVAADPDIVLVGLPLRETTHIALTYRDVLPNAWFVGIGVTFSFVTGDVQRAPGLVQKLGLEWVHRIVQEPRRMARRYLVDGLPFAASLLATSAQRGVRRRLKLGRTSNMVRSDHRSETSFGAWR